MDRRKKQNQPSKELRNCSRKKSYNKPGRYKQTGQIEASHYIAETIGRGKEFAKHEIFIKALKAEVYFADPHAPGQRETNENTNGLLRQFFPKRRSFESLTQEQVDQAVDLLNYHPRKCLGWRCRHEVFFKKCCT